MEKSTLNSLFGITTTTPMVEDEPPPAESAPFKIPTKIAERVMNNCYFGDGTVHPGDHLIFIHELCELFKCAGNGINCCRMADLLDGRKLYLSFILNFILQVRFIKI